MPTETTATPAPATADLAKIWNALSAPMRDALRYAKLGGDNPTARALLRRGLFAKTDPAYHGGHRTALGSKVAAYGVETAGYTAEVYGL